MKGQAAKGKKIAQPNRLRYFLCAVVAYGQNWGIWNWSVRLPTSWRTAAYTS